MDRRRSHHIHWDFHMVNTNRQLLFVISFFSFPDFEINAVVKRATIFRSK